MDIEETKPDEGSAELVRTVDLDVLKEREVPIDKADVLVVETPQEGYQLDNLLGNAEMQQHMFAKARSISEARKMLSGDVPEAALGVGIVMNPTRDYKKGNPWRPTTRFIREMREGKIRSASGKGYESTTVRILIHEEEVESVEKAIKTAKLSGVEVYGNVADLMLATGETRPVQKE